METTKGKKHQILVVDDNTDNIRIIGSILRNNEYQVGFATGGQQALEILTEDDEEYDLVLLDVNMPGMNGFEACGKIRETPQIKDLPVIFLTANTDSEHIIEGFKCGGQDYITKPFNIGELLVRVRTHIELRESREQLKQMNPILDQKVKERTRELEEANKMLQKANLELEKLDEAKVDFLRLISHEINTPLNGIIGLSVILKEQLISTDYFDLIEYLNNSAQRLNDFAQLSLIITNLRTSPDNYKKNVINLRNIVTEVIEEQKSGTEQKNVSTDFSCSANNLSIVANADLIKTCISHLLRNAIHYSPEGKPIKINCFATDKKLIFSIEDQGPGFSESALNNLFKPFSPGEEHIDKNKGLGLMVVKMITDFHNAQINISNKEESGALVELIFDIT